MNDLFDCLTALDNESREFQKKSRKGEKPKARVRQEDSVFARIAELNNEWQIGLLKGEPKS